MSWTYHKGVQDSGSSFLHIAALKWNIMAAPDGPIKSTQCWAMDGFLLSPYFLDGCAWKWIAPRHPQFFACLLRGKMTINHGKYMEIYGNIRYTAMGPWDLAPDPWHSKDSWRFASPLQSPFALLCPRRATMALHRPCPAFGSWRIFNFGRWERDCDKDDPQDLPLTRYRNIVIIMCLFDTEIASSY